MRKRLTVADFLAYGFSVSFVVAGLLTLAAGDSRTAASRYIRFPMDIAGPDRIIFGFALLGAGYVFLRWLFRTPGAIRRWRVELQVVAALAIAGYVAYRIGVA